MFKYELKTFHQLLLSCEIDMRIHIRLILEQATMNTTFSMFHFIFEQFSLANCFTSNYKWNVPFLFLRNLHSNIIWRKTNGKIGTFTRSFGFVEKHISIAIVSLENLISTSTNNIISVLNELLSSSGPWVMVLW